MSGPASVETPRQEVVPDEGLDSAAVLPAAEPVPSPSPEEPEVEESSAIEADASEGEVEGEVVQGPETEDSASPSEHEHSDPAVEPDQQLVAQTEPTPPPSPRAAGMPQGIELASKEEFQELVDFYTEQRRQAFRGIPEVNPYIGERIVYGMALQELHRRYGSSPKDQILAQQQLSSPLLPAPEAPPVSVAALQFAEVRPVQDGLFAAINELHQAKVLSNDARRVLLQKTQYSSAHLGTPDPAEGKVNFMGGDGVALLHALKQINAAAESVGEEGEIFGIPRKDLSSHLDHLIEQGGASKIVEFVPSDSLLLSPSATPELEPGPHPVDPATVA